MKKALLIFISLTLILPVLVLAQVIEIKNPLQTKDFEVIISNIIDFIFKIAIPLVPLMIIYAGLLFVTAGGNISQIDRAKKIIVWTAIGLGIVLLSKGIYLMIEQLLGV